MSMFCEADEPSIQETRYYASIWFPETKIPPLLHAHVRYWLGEKFLGEAFSG
jgi:hypothetical protein